MEVGPQPAQQPVVQDGKPSSPLYGQERHWPRRLKLAALARIVAIEMSGVELNFVDARSWVSMVPRERIWAR